MSHSDDILCDLERAHETVQGRIASQRAHRTPIACEFVQGRNAALIAE
jgi:hypothetical protein